MAPQKAEKTAAVAQEILSYCTSCKMDLNSTVVAMKGDRVAKVECMTCKKTHAFKAPKGAKEPKAKKSKKKDSAPAISIEAEWEKLMTTHKDAPMKSYTTKAVYALGDKINHSTFGQGIVGKLIYPNKMEVIFQTDIKVLITGGTTHHTGPTA